MNEGFCRANGNYDWVKDADWEALASIIIRDRLREDLLDGLLNWINHPEYVTVEIGEGKATAEYRNSAFACEWEIVSTELVVSQWIEVK